MQAYLNSDALSRFPEIELYEAVQTWLRHDRRRWRHTDTIVQSIRFCLMTPANIFEKVGSSRCLQSSHRRLCVNFLRPPPPHVQVKTSEFYRYSRQLRQEVDQALTYFHDVNQQPLVESRSNRIRSVRPQTAVFRGMIGHSMVNSKILLLQRPKVSACLEETRCLRERARAAFGRRAWLVSSQQLWLAPSGVVGAGGPSGATATRLPGHRQQLRLPVGRRGAGA